jgi:hypothetical protein
MHTDEPDALATIQQLEEEFEKHRQQQVKLLNTAVFKGMTPEELKEYEDRQKRISNLIERLGELEKHKSDST